MNGFMEMRKIVESYLVDITEPIQIPAIVYELRDRGKEGLVRVFLNHIEEPNIVRGVGQRIKGDLGVCEIKRLDGGKTWYHGRTKCFMEARTCETYNRFDNKKSDIDLLVELEKPIGWKFFTLEIYLEKAFGRKIDLVTKNALRNRL
jgi:hypothetical protein